MFSEFRPLLLNNAIVKTIMRLQPKKDTCYTSEKSRIQNCMVIYAKITHACGQRLGNVKNQK